MPYPVIYDQFGRPIFPREVILSAVLGKEWDQCETLEQRQDLSVATKPKPITRKVYNFGSIEWSDQ